MGTESERRKGAASTSAATGMSSEEGAGARRGPGRDALRGMPYEDGAAALSPEQVVGFGRTRPHLTQLRRRVAQMLASRAPDCARIQDRPDWEKHHFPIAASSVSRRPAFAPGRNMLDAVDMPLAVGPDDALARLYVPGMVEATNERCTERDGSGDVTIYSHAKVPIRFHFYVSAPHGHGVPELDTSVDWEEEVTLQSRFSQPGAISRLIGGEPALKAHEHVEAFTPTGIENLDI
jgi:hypothetical protein